MKSENNLLIAFSEGGSNDFGKKKYKIFFLLQTCKKTNLDNIL